MFGGVVSAPPTYIGTPGICSGDRSHCTIQDAQPVRNGGRVLHLCVAPVLDRLAGERRQVLADGHGAALLLFACRSWRTMRIGIKHPASMNAGRFGKRAKAVKSDENPLVPI